MKIFVIIPAYNEEKIIGQVVKAVKERFEEVVVIDDGSTDRTAELAKGAGAKILKHLVNRGQGAALKTGIDYSLNQEADVIVTFDADGQFLAEEIDKVIEPILRGEAEVVLGSRFLRNQSPIPRLKKILLKLAILFTIIYSKIQVTETHNGFRAFSYSAAQKIRLAQDGMAHASEILEEIVKNKLRYKEVPVTIKYTPYSLQKGQKLNSYFRILFDLFIKKLE